MSAPLARFQDEFARALIAPETALGPAMEALARQPGFAVYRNTVMKGCVDALQANYPAVLRLVGEEWFRAAAAVFVREHLPSQPTLLYYDERFADFLARFGPAAELPYLPGVARLDRLWTEAHAARDEVPLALTGIAGLTAQSPGDIVLSPHPAARWAWFGDQPIYTIWSRNREGAELGDLPWHGEGALLTRPHDAVRWTALDAGGCAFLDACAGGQSLADAANTAMAAGQSADLAQLLAALIGAGAFAAPNPAGNRPHSPGSRA